MGLYDNNQQSAWSSALPWLDISKPWRRVCFLGIVVSIANALNAAISLYENPEGWTYYQLSISICQLILFIHIINSKDIAFERIFIVLNIIDILKPIFSIFNIFPIIWYVPNFSIIPDFTSIMMALELYGDFNSIFISVIVNSLSILIFLWIIIKKREELEIFDPVKLEIDSPDEDESARLFIKANKLLVSSVAVALVASLAWLASPRGLDVETHLVGTGPMPRTGDVVFIKYTAKIADDGTVFSDSEELMRPARDELPDGIPIQIDDGAEYPGLHEGLKQMQKGGKYTLFIPADQAYKGDTPVGSPIPVDADADLIFEIEVVEIMSREAFQSKLRKLGQSILLEPR